MRNVLNCIFLLLLLAALCDRTTSYHVGNINYIHRLNHQVGCRSSTHKKRQVVTTFKSYNISSQRNSLLALQLKNNNAEDNSNSQPSNNDEKKKKKKKKDSSLGDEIRRSLIISTVLAGITNLVIDTIAPPGFKRVPIQWIAALGDPNSNSGSNAKEWGLWEKDPGPRGVLLKDFTSNVQNNGDDVLMPTGWVFQQSDWWLEEHGVVMEPPIFPVPPGRYLVTGGRLTSTILTIHESGAWKLDNGKLYDVTHLPCRAARYKPSGQNAAGSPFTAKEEDFPVKPGAEMPAVEGCDKQDYAVLFLIGIEK